MSSKNTKNKPSKICGKTQEQIRKAYFGGKLKEITEQMLALGEVTEESVKELTAFLEILEAEKAEMQKRVSAKFSLSIDEIQPPSVEDLQSKVDPERFAKWRERIEADVNYTRRLIYEIQMAAREKRIDLSLLPDVIVEITCLMLSLDQDMVFKDQLYRAQLTQLIDKFHISRAEASERAKITKEFKDYELARLLREAIPEFLMSCKKKLGNNY